MKTNIPNDILIIGGDHHNTLAVVRCLGRVGCNIKVLVHGNYEAISDVCLSKSKYAKGRTEFVADNTGEIIKWITSHKGTNHPAIVFPCSDFAAYSVDRHYELLSKDFLLPGFKGQPEKVTYLMDKFHQKAFADEYGLFMAKTWSIVSKEGVFQIPKDMVYPCVVKPEISATGKKADIVISDSAEELQVALVELSDKGYTKLLVQQFLIKEYEACAYGFMIDSNPQIGGGVVRKIREYPRRGGGSTGYAQFLTKMVPSYLMAQKVTRILYNEGYRGMFDIELLVCKDDIYLNEVNFRHSGNGYALVENGLLAPLYWCMDVAGVPIPADSKFFIADASYHMDELNDVKCIKAYNISLFSFLKNVVRSKAFAIWSISDLSGSMAFYKSWVIRVMKRFRGGEQNEEI